MSLQQSVGHAVDGGDIGVFLLQLAQRLPMAAAKHHRRKNRPSRESGATILRSTL